MVSEDVTDSYFTLAMDVNRDGNVDVVQSGLGIPAGSRGPNNPPNDVLGEVVWYENPNWRKHVIAKLSVPVGLHRGDVDGDGFEDIVISDQYGLCIFNCRPENGRVSWLRNPGKVLSQWEQHNIGNLMATHRLRFGYFTQTRTPEVLAFPIVGGVTGAVHDPVKVTLFRRPADPLTAKQWPSDVVDDKLRVLHGDTIGQFRRTGGMNLDSAILASEEGLSWLHYGEDRRWHKASIGVGETEEADEGKPVHWKGSGDVDVGRYRGDNAAYLVALEPFHGEKLVIYTKSSADRLDRAVWQRRVIDVYGKPTLATDEGPGHHVITGDFDRDGNDEFLVALRGPMPERGIYYYKVVDLKRAVLRRQRISSISASRIALADFDRDGRVDFCTVPYVVSTYFRAKDPMTMVYLNRIGSPAKGGHLVSIKP